MVGRGICFSDQYKKGTGHGEGFGSGETTGMGSAAGALLRERPDDCEILRKREGLCSDLLLLGSAHWAALDGTSARRLAARWRRRARASRPIRVFTFSLAAAWKSRFRPTAWRPFAAWLNACGNRARHPRRPFIKSCCVTRLRRLADAGLIPSASENLSLCEERRYEKEL